MGEGCKGYTAADHIITRAINATYADPDNVICLCNYHHIYWKPSHPTFYSDAVKKHIGTRKWNRIHKKSKQLTHYVLSDWLKEEKKLKRLIRNLEKRNSQTKTDS